MTSALLNLPPEKLEQYRQKAALRQITRLEKVKPRVAQAWKIAQKAAQVLREQFHATRVVAFGSLVHENRFHEWSDIDLAAWGLSADQTFRAMGAVMELDREFEINLVDVKACSPSLLASIEREGKEL